MPTFGGLHTLDQTGKAPNRLPTIGNRAVTVWPARYEPPD